MIIFYIVKIFFSFELHKTSGLLLSLPIHPPRRDHIISGMAEPGQKSLEKICWDIRLLCIILTVALILASKIGTDVITLLLNYPYSKHGIFLHNDYRV